MKKIIFAAFTVGCVGIGAAHMVWPTLAIDLITLSFVILAILPWIFPLVKSLELPGGAKIEFKEVENATERIVGSQPAPLTAATTAEIEEFSFVDPNLVLVALRMEIEKRLRKLAKNQDLSRTKAPISLLVKDLVGIEALKPSEVGGLLDLVALGNRAAHGEPVAPDAAEWAKKMGPQILALLDSKL